MSLDDFDLFNARTPASPAAPGPRRHRHRWALDLDGSTTCVFCGKERDETQARRGRNNRVRGGRAELDVARRTGGAKVGPLGHPWDVVMPGYARLQVRKVATPPSLRAIAAELARVAQAPGPEMPAYVWVQPGRGGERLIVLRLADFADRHGVPPVDD